MRTFNVPHPKQGDAVPQQKRSLGNPEARTRPRGLGVPPSQGSRPEHGAAVRDLRGPASGGDMPTRQLVPRRRREVRDL